MRAIDSLLKTTALATDGVKSYGHGPKHFANLIESKVPRVWIHEIKPQDKVNYGVMTTTYKVLGEVTTMGDFEMDDDGTLFDKILAEMEPVYEKYISLLSTNSSTLFMGNLSRIEVMFQGDQNLGGFAFSFDITIRKEYGKQCPQ